MKVKLINEPNNKLSAIEQVLYNRGITNINDYLYNAEAAVNPPEMLGESILNQAAATLVKHIQNCDPTLVIVDADADGFLSSALLINYLHDLFPSFVENNVSYFLHTGKQHGLSDSVEIAKNYKLVLIPDASSNDYSYHQTLAELGIDIIILDHHLAEYSSPYAITINNQLSDYPNKEFCGCGITFKFCEYLDKLLGHNFAQNYLDLVAISNMGDMMSMKSLETKHYIFKGLRTEHIKNPFIYEISKKNDFAMNKGDYKASTDNQLAFSPMAAAFFIVPFINAIVRSGDQSEKNLIFTSMLKHKAFEIVPSTKRGHKFGETERIVDQAMRICTNVKNRQTRAQDAGLELLEHLIIENNMLQHKVLLFLLEPGEIDRNIAGLIANKFMAKYQRPVCILTKVTNNETGHVSYQGSARGYGADMNFKDICSSAPGCIFAEGHQGAFGLGLDCGYPNDENLAEVCGDSIYQFLDYTDEVLKDMSSEPSYFVDYIWDSAEVDNKKILEIANMNDYWGKDIDRAYVYVTNIKVTGDSFKVMKSNTLKYSLPDVDIIQFGGTEEEIERLAEGDYVINAVCKCAANEWNFHISPQLILEDYEIVRFEKKDTISQWGF